MPGVFLASEHRTTARQPGFLLGVTGGMVAHCSATAAVAAPRAAPAPFSCGCLVASFSSTPESSTDLLHLHPLPVHSGDWFVIRILHSTPPVGDMDLQQLVVK
jgi:hypothetical protein